MKAININESFYLNRSHIDKMSPAFMTFASKLWKVLVDMDLMDKDPILFFERNIFGSDKLEIILRQTGEKISFSYGKDIKIRGTIGDILPLSRKIVESVVKLFMGIEDELVYKSDFYMMGIVDYWTHKIQINNTHVNEKSSKNKIY